jgi:hypothetical protein
MINSLQRETFLIEKNHENVHTLRSFYSGKEDWRRDVLLLSDLHWDNPKCDRDLLLKHLDEAKQKNATILINGDLFCLMQGRKDPRGNKSDIRPEHNESDYLDRVINTAVEFFTPYAEHIAVIGKGNHEESIHKYAETDPLCRFTDLLNLVARPNQNVYLGGYGGWIRFMFDRESSHDPKTFKMKYFHGSGGGGAVTKGMISNQRRQAHIQGAHIIWTGHIHENVTAVFCSEFLNAAGNIEIMETEHITTSTYKEEYATGHSGWHVERGAPPKPLGGSWLEFYYEKKQIKFRHYRAK